MTREQAIEHGKSQLEVFGGKHGDFIKLAIKALEQEPRTGKWIEHFDESGKWYECDQCHTDWGGAVNFCPNCGAKMAEQEG